MLKKKNRQQKKRRYINSTFYLTLISEVTETNILEGKIEKNR